ncbi:MAG: tRNA lysidine(34) synthetase TilS, partial [Lentisphaerae bacterium]|nr:tRNA lysidine(34) synthetase TilS [Lentisphaerota bacterium]
AMLSATQWRRRRLMVRNWQPGDRMRPYGLHGSRKLQDIFSDLKVPATQRSSIPLLVCGDEIIWLPSYRIAQAWALRPNERRMLLVEAQPSD